MSPTIKVKCTGCHHNYIAFVVKGKGHFLLNYPCPKCNSPSKAIFAGQDEKLEELKVEKDKPLKEKE